LFTLYTLLYALFVATKYIRQPITKHSQLKAHKIGYIVYTQTSMGLQYA